MVQLPFEQLGKSLNNLQARVDWKVSGKFSDSFVDTKIVDRLIQSKNQLIFGRRGTGKTHLLGKLKEEYLDRLENDQVLPIMVDGRKISDYARDTKDSFGFSILMLYRGFLGSVIVGLEDFMKEDISLGFLRRHFPNKDKQKKERVEKLIADLRDLISSGEVALKMGRAISKRSDATDMSKKEEAEAGLKVELKDKAVPDISAQLGASLSRVSSRNVAESLNILYEGSTLIKYDKVGEYLDSITELQLKSIAILFDEWSGIDLEYQPFLADMIRTTLVPVRMGEAKIFIKFACIPALTNLSATRGSSKEDIKPIGIPIGEEIFIDVDLDSIYNAYVDPNANTLFLLSILHKHLGNEIPELRKASFEDAYTFLRRNLFKSDENVSEMVYASAGVPRDFLVILMRAHQIAPGRFPITLEQIQLASNKFYQYEKKVLIAKDLEARQLFDRIYDEVCSPAQSFVFFVSQQYSKDLVLRKLWHNRLIHLLYSEFKASAGGKQARYDIYAIDYGSYILERQRAEVKEDYFLPLRKGGNIIKSWITPQAELGMIWNPKIERDLKARFSAIYESWAKNIDLGRLREDCTDCTELVADRVIQVGSPIYTPQ
jgi:hypothetical protein